MALTRTILVSGLLFLLLASCSKEFPNQPIGNNAPETYLSLAPDSSLRRTTSRQHIRWWGVDPDGLVIGYVFSFDSLQWKFTTRNDSIFALSLNTTDTTYTFYVSAVDNAGNGKYDAQTAWGPEPFDDLNNNGRWDAGEPFVDYGAIDPTPASLKYPIQNTPPVVSFLLKSDVPETTYTVATFQWSGTDLDGDATISKYYYALDDTSNSAAWKELPGTANRVTLFKSNGLTGGFHVFYLRATDIAGAESKTVRMPDTSKTWYVREPKGDLLIIDDYSPTDFAESFYRQVFDSLLMNGRLGSKDILDIKRGASSISRGKFVPALINPTFVETLKLFKYVLWYADNAPSLEMAQASLPEFKRAGGKVLFTSGFPENVTAQGSLVDFAPIENVESSFLALRLNAGEYLEPQVGSGYPTLYRDSLGAIYQFPRGVVPKIDARIIYRMQQSSRWTGQPIMAVKDADQARFVLVAALLHRFGRPPDNLVAFLRKVFQDEFGVIP